MPLLLRRFMLRYSADAPIFTPCYTLTLCYTRKRKIQRVAAIIYASASAAALLLPMIIDRLC